MADARLTDLISSDDMPRVEHSGNLYNQPSSYQDPTMSQQSAIMTSVANPVSITSAVSFPVTGSSSFDRGARSAIDSGSAIGGNSALGFSAAAASDSAVGGGAVASADVLGSAQGVSHETNENTDLSQTCDFIVEFVRSLNNRLFTLDFDGQNIAKSMNDKLLTILGAFSTDTGKKNPLDDSLEESDEDIPKYKPSVVHNKPKSVLRTNRAASQLNASNNSSISVDQLADILTRYDKRTVPKPEPFDISSGHDFSDFLTLFEEFCTNTYLGSSTLWLSELGRLLSGELLEAFQALRSPSDTYEIIKAKLLQWLHENRIAQSRDRKTGFSDASRQPGERIRLYAARLEKLFRVAYPSKNVQSSKTLRDKFIKTVPTALQQQIASMRNVGLALHNSEITWATIIILAGVFDTEHQVAVNHAPVVNVANVGNASYRPVSTDAVTQYDAGNFEYVTSKNRQSRPRSRERTPVRDRSSSSSRNKTCFYCKKVGHIRSECRKLKGLCLVCGSPDHKLSQCPSRKASLQSGERVLSQVNKSSSAPYVPNINATSFDPRNPSGSNHIPDLSRPPPAHATYYSSRSADERRDNLN